MKKILRVVLSSLTLASLISCGVSQPEIKNSNSEKTIDNPSSASISSDITEEPSSISSIDSSIETYYHVIFKNYDETILEEIDVKEGEEAIYSGETPTKEEDDEFTYEFEGWDQDLANIQSDVTTYAQYTATGKEGWGPIIWF